MIVSRRTVLRVAAATGAAIALPRFAIAEVALSSGATVTSVSDGNLVLPIDFMLGTLPAEDAAPILDAAGITGDTVEPPCNLTLYKSGDRTVLFDVGSGSEFMPTAGKLFENLDAVGVSPDDITDVIFTHAHPDHLWGLLDDFGDPAFPGAAFHIGQAEWDYWTDPALIESIAPERQAFAVGAARRLEMIADTVAFLADGDEPVPGVVAMATHGHTPGHLSFRVGEEIVVLGDAVTNPHLNFVHPEWPSGSDQNADLGADTRVALLDMLASEGLQVLGFHLPSGGIGRVERAGEGYRFVAS